jgi:hypothetical protein
MTTTEAKPAASPGDLLKAAVAGKAETPATIKKAAKALRVPPWLRRNARVCGIAGAALALGGAVGAGAMALVPARGRAPDPALASVRSGLEAGRRETARLSGEIAALQQALTDLRGLAEATRKEATTRGNGISERLAQVDRTVATKFTALGERIEQAEREQTARIASLAAQPERRAAPAPAAKAEPVQTGSLAEPKPAEAKAADKAAEAKAAEAKAKPAADAKLPVIDSWAVRDVYDGAAIVENRRHRLAQVVPGDTLPGAGQVESVERQGRNWVVITRQGIITPQPW